MKLIDVGCGCGDWLKYCQDKGVQVVGINSSKGQVDECHRRGLEVYHLNWKDLEYKEDINKKLYHQFDRVTFWDTVEHYVPARMMRCSMQQEKEKIYFNMYRMTRYLLKPGNQGKVFISCLHLRKDLFSFGFWERWKKMCYIIVLDKFHSGNYPSYSDDQLVRTAQPFFTLVHRKDATMDYYMTSVLEKTHFGRHKFKMTMERLFILASLVILDPYWFYRYIWLTTETWMCQFDRKDIHNSDVILWWLTFKTT